MYRTCPASLLHYRKIHFTAQLTRIAIVGVVRLFRRLWAVAQQNDINVE